LCQTMVDSWYCLDRVVPERMSQVWRRSEVRNHKRRSLNTRLSSGTSANTSCTSRNAPGRMIRSDFFWYGNNLKIKPTYREKNLLDYLFGGFRSTLNELWEGNRNSHSHNSDTVMGTGREAGIFLLKKLCRRQPANFFFENR